MKKIKFLEGLRGLMSINVVLNHVFVVFYPTLLYINFNDTTKYQKWFASSIFASFINGNIAVQYFFILSSFLLAISIMKKNNKFSIKDIVSKFIKRYLRLLPVVFSSIFLMFILMKTNLVYVSKIKDLMINYNFFNNKLNFRPSFTLALYDALVSTFFIKNIYISPFWTIKNEMMGFIFVLILVSLFKNSKFRRIIYVCLCIILYAFRRTDLVIFIFGIILADLYYKNELETTLLSNKYYKCINSKIFIYLCLIIGLYFATIPYTYTGIHSIFKPLKKYLYIYTVRAFGVTLSIYALLKLEKIQRIFENKYLLFLGKISFCTYAIHWPIMVSLQYFLFYIFIKNNILYLWSVFLSFILTLPVIILSSYLIYKYIDSKNILNNLFRKVSIYLKG